MTSTKKKKVGSSSRISLSKQKLITPLRTHKSETQYYLRFDELNQFGIFFFFLISNVKFIQIIKKESAKCIQLGIIAIKYISYKHLLSHRLKKMEWFPTMDIQSVRLD